MPSGITLHMFFMYILLSGKFVIGEAIFFYIDVPENL